MAFSIRTSKPAKGNKFYNTKANGGYSTCIAGKPTDVCNVLANCVGYACGRFNEIIGSMKYPSLNCNAENFIERAKSMGLTIVSYPTLGGIMVWQKGGTLDDSDGAGHVEIVERIDSANQIYTSASNYGGTAFYNSLRTNSNGRWGLGSKYSFRGCIVNPSIGDVHYTEPVTPSTDSFKHAIGETVRFTTCYRSSTDAAAIKNYILAKNMKKDTGKITRRLKVNGVSTYLLDNGLCWVNDGDIVGGNTSANACPFKKSGTVEAIEKNIRVRTAPSLSKGDTGLRYQPGERLIYNDVVSADGWYWAKYKRSLNGASGTGYCALCKIDSTSKFWKQV